MRQLLSLAIVLVALFPVSSFARDSVYERVLKSGTLRCGYVVYQPAVLKDPNTGRFSGFGYDIVNRMAEDLNLKVEWVEEVTPATMLEGLNTDRYDMICTPFWRNSERGRVADFSVAFYYSPMGVWVRSDDHRFDKNVSDLNKPTVTLSVMDGTTLAVIARQDFPNAKTMAITQSAPLTDLLLNVTTKKADAVAIDNYLAKDFLAKNPKSIRDVTEQNPVRVYANGFIFKLDEPAFKAMIDSALAELMNDGFVDQIITKYEKYPHTFYRVQKSWSK